MKILTLCFLFGCVAHATSYAPLEFAAAPSPAQMLEKNGLANAEEEVLWNYLFKNWDAAGCWLPELTKFEQDAISSEYFRRSGLEDGDSKMYLESARAQLQIDRLADPRRIVDAALRELGRRGTEKSLSRLLVFPTIEEREWVSWKALASVQEILGRVDPSQLDDRSLTNISADLVAPLLSDLDSDTADNWAWTLWKHHRKWLSVSFRSEVRLRTRIWLARAFAESHPDEAFEVFREGLRSQDAAIRTATEMIIRSGIGGSLPYGTSTEQILAMFKIREWYSARPLWETLPLPLDQPLLRKLVGGRTDLIWLSNDAKVSRSSDDVWPLIRESLTGESFYTRVGDFYPMEYGFSDAEGKLHSRFRRIYSAPTIASHGGLLALVGHNRVAEFLTDGSVMWECHLDKRGYRKVVSVADGRVVLLGYKFIECRDRRGDLLWRTDLEALDDPRHIVPVDDNRFLVSCGKSIGWLTRDGKYDPILKELGSAGWVRYHPVEPWIVWDGSIGTAIVFDPKTNKELGRFDLDDGVGSGKSRFPFPPTCLPE